MRSILELCQQAEIRTRRQGRGEVLSVPAGSGWDPESMIYDYAARLKEPTPRPIYFPKYWVEAMAALHGCTTDAYLDWLITPGSSYEARMGWESSGPWHDWTETFGQRLDRLRRRARGSQD